MRGIPGGLASKRAADRRAPALVPIIRKLMAPGFVSYRALADELNRKGIPAARGGRWHYTTLVRMLKRLGLNTSGSNGLAIKRAADARAKALASTIRELRMAGFVSIRAITRELRARDTNRAGRQMAPKQRQATPAPPGKVGASVRSPTPVNDDELRQPTSTLGPFFCP
jgi:recombinase